MGSDLGSTIFLALLAVRRYLSRLPSSANCSSSLFSRGYRTIASALIEQTDLDWLDFPDFPDFIAAVFKTFIIFYQGTVK